MTIRARHSPKVQEVEQRYARLLDEVLESPEWGFAWRRKLNRGGFRAVDFLMSEVVDTGKCVGCAACVTICPTDVFDYVDERPVDARSDGCVLCVLCAEVCQVLRPQDADVSSLVGYRDDATDVGYGSASYGLYVRSTRPDVLGRGQDGGMVSGLLLWALETGEIEGAILGDVLPDNNQVGRHKLAMTEDEVLSCAASRYTYSPNTLAFSEAMARDVAPVAVVGVPCQIDGVRLSQNSSIRSEMAAWYRKNVVLSIGLFCSEAFTHESIERLAELIEVEPHRIDNINIKGKVVVRLDDGSVVNSSLRKYREWARPACLYCRDYSAEHADIAAGGIGLDGWTFTLVRTETGHRFLQGALDAGVLEARPLDDEPRGQFLLEKLSADKKLNRPHPALMPTHSEREEAGWLDPKTYYSKGPGAPVGVEG